MTHADDKDYEIKVTNIGVYNIYKIVRDGSKNSYGAILIENDTFFKPPLNKLFSFDTLTEAVKFSSIDFS